jgi:hypothetical protein
MKPHGESVETHAQYAGRQAVIITAISQQALPSNLSTSFCSLDTVRSASDERFSAWVT